MNKGEVAVLGHEAMNMNPKTHQGLLKGHKTLWLDPNINRHVVFSLLPLLPAACLLCTSRRMLYIPADPLNPVSKAR